MGLLAILKAGGAYVPLDPAYPEERLAFMVEDSAPVALLVHGATRERLAALAGGVPMVDLEAEAGAWAERSVTNPQPAALGLRSEHLAYVIYTSGSTGKPKGVMVEHRSIVNRLLWMQTAHGLGAEDVVLQKTPFSFDVSLWEFFWPLLAGARLVLARPEGHKDPRYLAEVIRHEGITTLHFVPSMLQVFLEQPLSAGFPCLRRVFCSGEALPAELVDRFQSRLPASELHNLYGPTEAAVDVTAWDCAETPPISGTIPIGRPIANTQIYVLDGDRQPVPIGVAGEMYIGGAGVARGYLNRPELTEERFLPDPFSPEGGARMYRTGDLARWLPDGNLEYIGRADFQVKIRGFRIELGEIEAALRGCDGIREAVVLAREEGSGEKRLVAYVTTDVTTDRAGDSVDTAASVAAQIAGLPGELKARLRSRLPEYMVPAAFVVLESLPLTPNGKVDRKALPTPEAEAYAVHAYEPPAGSVEEALAALWVELLGIERVGRQDDFFALGGHSLLAVSLVERMRRQGLPVDVRALFTTPTLAELASVVGDAAEVAVPPNRIPLDCSRLTPELLPLVSLEQAAIDRIVATVPGGAGNVQDIYPLGPLQEGLLFHHLLQREGDAYVLAALFGFDKRERLESFLRAFEAVIARHPLCQERSPPGLTRPPGGQPNHHETDL